MLTQGKTHIHSRVGHRDFNPAARTRKEQHQGRQRQRHTDREHHPGNFSGFRFPGTLAIVEDLRTTARTQTERVRNNKGNSPGKTESDHRQPKNRSE